MVVHKAGIGVNTWEYQKDIFVCFNLDNRKGYQESKILTLGFD